MIQKGLKGVVCTETTISHIDGENGKLIYRGYPIEYLVTNFSFEEVAYLLWHGNLPNQHELEHLKTKLIQARRLPDYLKHIIDQLPSRIDMLSVIRTAISATSISSSNNLLVDDAISITSLIPLIISYRHANLHGTTYPKIRTDLRHVENYLYMMTGELPKENHIKALEAYMILTLEHGLNASTFSARVTASTESDIVSAITSAIGTMKGPLHGGAPTGVLTLLDEASSCSNLREFIKEKIERGEKLMGFGHRVYRVVDPRAVVLKGLLNNIKTENDWLDLAIQVEKTAISVLNELKPGRNLYTNVEFYTAAIMRELQLDPSLFTATFTSSRIVGWTTHVIEQLQDNVIFRPRAQYVGPFHEKNRV